MILLGAVETLLALACAAILYKASQSARASWKTYRGGLRQPLLAKLSGQDLRTMTVQWPVSERRWPRPSARPDAPMDRVIADAYERLARRAGRRSTMAAQVLALVGGAWLGAYMPAVVGAFGTPRGFEIGSMAFWRLAGAVVTIELSLLVGDLTNDFDTIAEVYARHASRPDDSVPPDTVGRPPLLARVRATLRGGSRVRPNRV